MKLHKSTRIPWEKVEPLNNTQPAPWLNPSKTHKPKNNQTKNKHLETGKQGEQKAEQFLLNQGLSLEDTNYRCKCGEIDLIMSQAYTAIIVEVRVRNNISHGSGLDSILPAKQKRIFKCAQLWWQKIGQYKFQTLRFDAVDVCDQRPINWVKNAWCINDL